MNTRALRPKILIVCEGEKTEPNYFKRFRVRLDIKTIGLGKDPLHVVQRAQDEAAKTKYDQVWCVFDKDDFSSGDFNTAIQTAAQKGFHTAYSNPKFELWYLLHFAYHTTAIPRDEYDIKLSNYLGEVYAKTHVGMYDLLMERRETAVAHATHLLENYHPHNPAQDDPCTTVHQLVQTLTDAQP